MKTKTLLLAILISLLSCEKNEDKKTNTIIGHWKLEAKKINNNNIILNDCQLQSFVNFTSYGYNSNVDRGDVYFNFYIFNEDTSNCENHVSHYVWNNFTGSYKLERNSIFNQNHTIFIKNGKLHYTYLSLNIQNGVSETSEIELIYFKMN